MKTFFSFTPSTDTEQLFNQIIQAAKYAKRYIDAEINLDFVEEDFDCPALLWDCSEAAHVAERALESLLYSDMKICFGSGINDRVELCAPEHSVEIKPLSISERIAADI